MRKSGYLDNLIYRYEQGLISDEDVCDNITRITNRDEYIQDVNSNRLKEKITNKYWFVRLGKSPEEIVIGWEEDEKILHFISWIKSVLSKKEWEIFREYNLNNVTRKKLAQQMETTKSSIDYYLTRAGKKIQKAIPFYTAQFGDLQKYLKGEDDEEEKTSTC